MCFTYQPLGLSCVSLANYVPTDQMSSDPYGSDKYIHIYHYKMTMIGGLFI